MHRFQTGGLGTPELRLSKFMREGGSTFTGFSPLISFGLAVSHLKMCKNVKRQNWKLALLKVLNARLNRAS